MVTAYLLVGKKMQSCEITNKLHRQLRKRALREKLSLAEILEKARKTKLSRKAIEKYLNK